MILLFLMIAMAAVSINRVNTINGQLKTINDVNSVKQRYTINFRGSVHDRAIRLRDVVLVSDPAELATVLADIDRLGANYAASAKPWMRSWRRVGKSRPTKLRSSPPSRRPRQRPCP
uniref:MCP four helix bundle domain-containing protein n=1 Tax=Phenylobacterium glaciei TaxID=2803784 RepID=A0A974P2Q3_9CAUL|nr:MCP four helix bundle domain-containing protein [Phenylobacterium glaciei]